MEEEVYYNIKLKDFIPLKGMKSYLDRSVRAGFAKKELLTKVAPRYGIIAVYNTGLAFLALNVAATGLAKLVTN